jgi:Cdc6-like AAA superfamily ATPase
MNSISSRLTNKILKRLNEEVVFPLSMYTAATLKIILKEELNEVKFKKENHRK